MTVAWAEKDELRAAVPERLDVSGITLDPSQQAALDAMRAGHNVFLTGEAGSGKSTVLRLFRQSAGAECVYVAPTGVAAVNIGGTTIHSLFQLKPVLLTPRDVGVLRGRRRALLKKIRTVIVDEVSMMRSDLFCALDERLREVADYADAGRPFGGRQIILVGDFQQLAPVVGKPAEKRWLIENLGGIFAFQTRLWQEAGFRCVNLSFPHRQQNDASFLALLRSVRIGELDVPMAECGGRTVMEMLAERTGRGKEAEDGVPAVALCTTNREADAINSAMCAALESEPVLFRASREGTFNERDFPTEEVLELKPGARVMILSNYHLPDGGFLYVNGDTGVFRGCRGRGPGRVALVELDNGGGEVEVTPFRWSNYEYDFKYNTVTRRNDIERKETGAFVQMPLRLAYAVTIHKAQGMTIARVNLKLGGGCFAHGQLYTALSRCRTLNGLHLDRKLHHEDLQQYAAVTEFYRRMLNGELDAPPPAPESVPAPAEMVPMMVPAALLPAMERYLKKLLRRSGLSLESPDE